MNTDITDRHLVTFTLDGDTVPEDSADAARAIINRQVAPDPFTVLIDARSLDIADVRPSDIHREAMVIGDVALAHDPRCLGAAFLVPEDMRAPLGSVLRMKSWNTPHAIFAKPDRARDWLVSLQPRKRTSEPVSSAIEKWLG
jgi:hypothetical protein